MNDEERDLTIGPDVDLEREDVRDAQGRRITEEYVERALSDILDEDAPVTPSSVTYPRRGRRSLTGSGVHSPRVSFRVSDDLQRRAQAKARREGKTVSVLAREALERYVSS